MASANVTPASGALREQRLAIGLSQQRLAELAGCSVSAVRLFERGYRPDPSAVLERVEAVINSEAAGGNRGSAKSAGCGDGHGEAYP